MASHKKEFGPFLTPAEVADILRVHKRTIYRYVELGILKAVRPTDGVIRIREDELKRFIKKYETKSQLGFGF